MQRLPLLPDHLLRQPQTLFAAPCHEFMEVPTPNHTHWPVDTVILRNRDLKRAFNSLRACGQIDDHDAARLSAALAQWLNALLGKAFRSWREIAAERGAMTARLRGILSNWLNSLLGRAWRQWRESYLHPSCFDPHAQQLALGALRRWLRMQLGRAWRQWIDYAQARRRRKKREPPLPPAPPVDDPWAKYLLNKALQFWLHNMLARAWNKWKEMAAMAGSGRRALLSWLNRSLKRAFNQWRDAASNANFEALLQERLAKALAWWLNR